MRGCYLDDDAFDRAIALLVARQPQEITRAIEAAEHHVRGEFAPMNTMAGSRWTSLGQPVDWQLNPTDDPEFTWQINRFWHLKDFGLAWRATGDRRYLTAFKDHIDGWIASNPVPWDEPWQQATYFQRLGPWRLLEAGLRSEQWLRGWQFVANGFADDPAFAARFRAALVDHAEWLSQRLGSPEINHAMMHMLGLLLIAAALPEHPRAPLWRQVATERFGLCLYRQVRADGVHAELTPGYHNVSVELFVKPCLIGRRSGHVMPAWFVERVASMARFSAATLRADGSTSGISDWEPNEAGRVALGQIGLLTGDEALITQGTANAETLWMFGAEAWLRLTERARFASPAASVAFPDSGYFILRKPETVILFDAAAMGGPHGHADALSFEWSRGAHGLVIDPGRYTYEEGDWRRWFKGTRAHSTVEIDGVDQSLYVSTQAWHEPTARCQTLRFISNDSFDYCEAEHDGYTRLDVPVVHRRGFAFLKEADIVVIIDRLTGAGKHAFVARLHVAPARDFVVASTARDGAMTADIQLRDGENRLWVSAWATGDIAAADLDCEASWYAPRYAEKHETQALALSGSFAGHCTLVTVVQRLAPSALPASVALKNDGVDGGLTVVIHRDGAEHSFSITADAVGWDTGR